MPCLRCFSQGQTAVLNLHLSVLQITCWLPLTVVAATTLLDLTGAFGAVSENILLHCREKKTSLFLVPFFSTLDLISLTYSSLLTDGLRWGLSHLLLVVPEDFILGPTIIYLYRFFLFIYFFYTGSLLNSTYCIRHSRTSSFVFIFHAPEWSSSTYRLLSFISSIMCIIAKHMPGYC